MLSCNTGEGHNSTANAIREVLEQRNVECQIIDVLGSCISPKFSKFICNSHTRLYKYAPKLWDVGYRVSDRWQLEREQDQEDNKMLHELLSSSAKKLERIIVEGNFNVVLCVHAFSGMMMTVVRKSRAVNIPCYFVATDYTCSPLVDQCDADGYFIPAADLKNEFVADGLPGDKLIPSGIPVRQAFYQRVERAAAREALGLPKEGLMVLMMCGSMGCGPLRKIARDLAERLPKGATVVAVCGRNEKLYEDLLEENASGLRVLGYCKEVPLYMDASDIIVTKPGGLSSTEAATKYLPMVFINAVGGCEGRNFSYFLTHGYALGSDESREVADLVVNLVNCEEQLARMRQTLRSNFTVNSAEFIAAYLMKAGESAASKSE